MTSHLVSLASSTGGTIVALPGSSASASVPEGASQSFRVTPTAGYRLVSVTASPSTGGTLLGADTSWTLADVTADTSVTATFEQLSPPPAQDYTVSFDGNPPAGASVTGTTAQLTVAPGDAATLPAGGFAVSGYDFTGWNTQPDGGGTGFRTGDSFTPSGTVTLYAQWAADAATQPGQPSGPSQPSQPSGASQPSGPSGSPSPLLTVRASRVHHGDTEAVTGTGFDPGERMTVVLHSAPITLGAVTAAADGTLGYSFVVPASLDPGTHTVVLSSAGADVASATFVVLPDPANAASGPEDPLALTGTQLASGVIAAALATVVAGAVLLIATARRRSPIPSRSVGRLTARPPGRASGSRASRRRTSSSRRG